jgi:hypothetical protein
LHKKIKKYFHKIKKIFEKTLDKPAHLMYNIGVRKRERYKVMKRDYHILVNNKTYCTRTLEWAIDIARRESLVGGRVSVLKDGKKLATYENGDLKEKNY